MGTYSPVALPTVPSYTITWSGNRYAEVGLTVHQPDTYSALRRDRKSLPVRTPKFMFLLHFRHLSAFPGRALSSSTTSQVRQFKVVLDGQTVYIEKPLAEALGWKPGTSAEGVSLPLSGWEPKFFAITRRTMTPVCASRRLAVQRSTPE